LVKDKRTAEGNVVSSREMVTMKPPKSSAPEITHILKEIGKLVKGGMREGIGVIAVGSAIVGGIVVVITNKLIPDPELRDLKEKLKIANELYEAARRVTEQQKAEIDELNAKIGEILRSKKKDQKQLESLKARLITLIEQLKGAA